MGPDPIGLASLREDGNFNTQRKLGLVKTGGEIRVTPPPAKEHLEPPETGRDEEGFAPEALGKCRSASTLIPDL